MHCSIPKATSKELSQLFATDLQIQKTIAVGPDERIYYCDNDYIVWVRDYMPEDCKVSEPKELKAMLNLKVEVVDLRDYGDNRYMLCKQFF